MAEAAKIIDPMAFSLTGQHYGQSGLPAMPTALQSIAADKARAILSLIRPALEAKERQRCYWLSKHDDLAEEVRQLEEDRRAAEAKLAQAVEALDDAALFMDGDISGVEQRIRIVIACRTAASAIRGEKT